MPTPHTVTLFTTGARARYPSIADTSEKEIVKCSRKARAHAHAGYAVPVLVLVLVEDAPLGGHPQARATLWLSLLFLCFA